MVDTVNPPDTSVAQHGKLGDLTLAAGWAAAGAVATQAVFYVVDLGYRMSGRMQSSYVAPAAIGASIIFAALLVVTALSYWKSRKETREALRDLSEVSRLVTNGLVQADRIAAIGKTLHRSDP